MVNKIYLFLIYLTFYLDYNYISRAVRGLIALGEYAFREFIPFLYKLKADDIPESLWNDFAVILLYF